MKQYFLKLYQYNAWANDRVLASMKKQFVSEKKILSLLGHILAAQFLWLHRIKALAPPVYKLWGDYPFDELEGMAAEAGKLWLDFIEKNDNFNRELTYSNYVGDRYTNNVETIMIHLVNHSSYHRAQIAMLLRQNGLEPVNTDFITYDRIIRGELKE